MASGVARSLRIEGMTWDEFEPWFAREWTQGQHIAAIGPTGEGKTNLMCPLLCLRDHVLALDAKGGDRTLGRLITERGWKRQSTWPLSSRQWDAIERGEPVRLVVGRTLRQMEDMAANAKLLGQVLHDVFAQRGWTIGIDETQMTADRKYMALGKLIELNLIAGRDRGISIVTLYQRPANVPLAASQMATWVILYYTKDRDVVVDLARMTGREPAEIWGAMQALEKYCVLIIKNNPREPMIITKAPRF